jgi:hypothetical protein
VVRNLEPPLSACRPDLLIGWVPGTLSPRVKRPGCEAHLSPPTWARFKKTCSTRIHALLRAPSWRSARLVKHRDKFTLPYSATMVSLTDAKDNKGDPTITALSLSYETWRRPPLWWIHYLRQCVKMRILAVTTFVSRKDKFTVKYILLTSLYIYTLMPYQGVYRSLSNIYRSRVSVKERIFCQTGSRVYPASNPTSIRGYVSWLKETEAWSWPLTSNCCRRQEDVFTATVSYNFMV